MEQLTFHEFVTLFEALKVLEETTRKEAIENYHQNGADLRPAMQDLERMSNLKHKLDKISIESLKQ